ncbi:MAG: RNA methyltransferase, partial [Myxococcales bacterium]|nr:RNA methyltransferase [Myxococcales bacterium]
YDVLDPGNLGALTRTAHALGAAAVIWVRGTHPMHPKALRSSMGSCFRVPWAHVSLPCDEVVGLLSAGGWRNVATLTKRSQPLPDRINGPCAVWMGSEAHGLPEDAAWDLRVRIPMAPDIDSLSVNAAAAIVMSRVGHAAVT